MESGDEDDAFTMGEREWLKMERNISKQGLRDGKSEGREKGLQQSFETTAKIALKYSQKLGELAGIIEFKMTSCEDQIFKDKLNNMLRKVTLENERHMQDSTRYTDLHNGSNLYVQMEEAWKSSIQQIFKELQEIDATEDWKRIM